MTNQELAKEDLKYIFHPCSQMKDYEDLPLIPIKEAKGAYIYDYDGNRYLDTISSWWVNLFGHQNPYINKKLIEQLNKLEHTIFAGFTHEPAINLAKRLIKLTPKELSKVFFADNGSSAVEIALKMAFQFYKNQNITKPLFVSLENSYHGETMGALAVSDTGLYKDVYRDILLTTIQAPSPAIVNEDEAIDGLRDIFQKYHKQISSMIIEPLVQCAGLMKMYKPSYLKRVRELCDEFKIFLIADEIAVGFGRTGKMFACEHANITPDFLCLSKGITGGYLPLSVVLFKEEIYNAFYCDYKEGKSFLDSHSYTGNALACAAANATLDIFENENILEKNQILISYMKDLTQKFKKLPNVAEVRQTGFICAIELCGYDPNRRINLEIFKQALKQEVFIRPLANVIYFMPPYICTKEEIKKMVDTIYDIVLKL